jgi:hypothetical protein
LKKIWRAWTSEPTESNRKTAPAREEEVVSEYKQMCQKTNLLTGFTLRLFLCSEVSRFMMIMIMTKVIAVLN